MDTYAYRAIVDVIPDVTKQKKKKVLAMKE